MNTFNLSIPTRIYFGDGVLESALQDEKPILFGNVMIVTGKQSMRKLGHLDTLNTILSNIESINDITLFEGISPNPKAEEINQAVQYGIKSNVRIVIGLGGGSCIDAAKAIAVGIASNEKIENFMFEEKVLPKNTLPIIAIPTTAGTGTELSKAAIITSCSKKMKIGIRGASIYPKVAIVDPRLTLGVPPNITAESGFDVFAHAVESYISVKSNPFTEMLSVEAIKIVCENLPNAISERNNIELYKRNMSYSSMLMGINLGNSGTCLPHRLQYPLGALTDTSHGRGLASIYKAWFSLSYEHSKAKFDKISSLLLGKECTTKHEAIEGLNIFMDKLKLNVTLKNLGIGIKDLDDIYFRITGDIYSDPVVTEKNIIQKIFEASI